MLRNVISKLFTIDSTWLTHTRRCWRRCRCLAFVWFAWFIRFTCNSHEIRGKNLKICYFVVASAVRQQWHVLWQGVGYRGVCEAIRDMSMRGGRRGSNFRRIFSAKKRKRNFISWCHDASLNNLTKWTDIRLTNVLITDTATLSRGEQKEEENGD